MTQIKSDKKEDIALYNVLHSFLFQFYFFQYKGEEIVISYPFLSYSIPSFLSLQMRGNCLFQLSYIAFFFNVKVAQSAGAVEYTDCTSAEG